MARASSTAYKALTCPVSEACKKPTNGIAGFIMSNFLKSSIAGAALIALAACGGSNEADAPAPAPEPAPQETSEAPAETPPAEPEAEVETASAPEPEATPPAAAETDGASEFADLPEPYKSADYSRGKRVFRTCSSCHLLDPEAGNLVGPNLHGLFDRKSGTLEGFTYSQALLEADFQWTPEQLDNWLANPRTFLPGNNMSFTGVRRDQDRQAVIAYLMVETAK